MIVMGTARAVLRGIVKDLSTPRGCDVWRDIQWDYRAICTYMQASEDDPHLRGAALDELFEALSYRMEHFDPASLSLEQVRELDDLLSLTHTLGIKACMAVSA